MKYYVEIELLEEAEIKLGFIWKKLYTQIHLSLVELLNEEDKAILGLSDSIKTHKTKDLENKISIGLSFPNYQQNKFPLGEKLRLFAKTKEELEKLNLAHWLRRLMDYVTISEIQKIPANIDSFVSFSRKRFKSNSEIRRLAKRYAKREGIEYEEALKKFVETEEKYEKVKKENKLPYINIQSLSSNQELKLFIEKKERDKPKDGLFSTYGLSHESTVPSF